MLLCVGVGLYVVGLRTPTRIHTHNQVHAHTVTHIRLHTSTHTQLRTRMHTNHSCMYTHTNIGFTHKRALVRIHIHTHFSYIHTHLVTCTHTHHTHSSRSYHVCKGLAPQAPMYYRSTLHYHHSCPPVRLRQVPPQQCSPPRHHSCQSREYGPDVGFVRAIV